MLYAYDCIALSCIRIFILTSLRRWRRCSTSWSFAVHEIPTEILLIFREVLEERASDLVSEWLMRYSSSMRIVRAWSMLSYKLARLIWVGEAAAWFKTCCRSARIDLKADTSLVRKSIFGGASNRRRIFLSSSFQQVSSGQDYRCHSRGNSV